MEKRLTYLSLGSNLEHREALLGRAIRSLMDDAPRSRIPILTDIRVSPIYETDPVGKRDQPLFLNVVVEGYTVLTSEELLAAVQRIERDLGRKPREHHGPREIDIDILYIDGEARDNDPILPHPAMHLREFVLRPLTDLAPELILPHQRFTASELLAALPDQGVHRRERQWEDFSPETTRDLIPTVSRIQDVSDVLREGLCGVGAVRIENALPSHITTSLQDEATALFRLPDEVTRRCLRSNGHSGYTPPGIEGVNGHGQDQLRHFWDMSANEMYESVPETDAFCAVARDLSSRVYELTGSLFQAFDRLFGTFVSTDVSGGSHLLRVSEYLNQNTSPWHVLFPSHLDFGLLTAYIGGAAEGLQVKIHGAWYDVWNPPGSVVFGVGSTLKLYAPNDLTTIRHRVVATHIGRISAVLFTEPRSDVILPNGARADDHLRQFVQKIRKEP